MVLVTAGNFSLPRRRQPRAGCTCQELDLTAITRLIRDTGATRRVVAMTPCLAHPEIAGERRVACRP